MNKRTGQALQWEDQQYWFCAHKPRYIFITKHMMNSRIVSEIFHEIWGYTPRRHHTSVDITSLWNNWLVLPIWAYVQKLRAPCFSVGRMQERRWKRVNTDCMICRPLYTVKMRHTCCNCKELQNRKKAFKWAWGRCRPSSCSFQRSRKGFRSV